MGRDASRVRLMPPRRCLSLLRTGHAGILRSRGLAIKDPFCITDLTPTLMRVVCQNAKRRSMFGASCCQGTSCSCFPPFGSRMLLHYPWCTHPQHRRRHRRSRWVFHCHGPWANTRRSLEEPAARDGQNFKLPSSVGHSSYLYNDVKAPTDVHKNKKRTDSTIAPKSL